MTVRFTDKVALVTGGNSGIGLATANSSVCGASKAAVVNLAKTLSADLLPRGVRVNAISPGPVATPIFDRMGQPEEQARQTKDWIVGQIPLKRFADGDEIAPAVLYLASSDSAFVVGTELVIDGGMIQL